MVHHLIAFFSGASSVLRDALVLRAKLTRKYRWMSE
jgi:hypothetical protein